MMIHTSIHMNVIHVIAISVFNIDMLNYLACFSIARERFNNIWAVAFPPVFQNHAFQIMTVKLLWWNTLTIHQCQAKFSQWRELYTRAFCNQFDRVRKQRTPRHKWYRKLPQTPSWCTWDCSHVGSHQDHLDMTGDKATKQVWKFKIAYSSCKNPLSQPECLPYRATACQWMVVQKSI